jgi:hypothetical protein
MPRKLIYNKSFNFSFSVLIISLLLLLFLLFMDNAPEDIMANWLITVVIFAPAFIVIGVFSFRIYPFYVEVSDDRIAILRGIGLLSFVRIYDRKDIVRIHMKRTESGNSYKLFINPGSPSPFGINFFMVSIEIGGEVDRLYSDVVNKSTREVTTLWPEDEE